MGDEITEEAVPAAAETRTPDQITAAGTALSMSVAQVARSRAPGPSFAATLAYIAQRAPTLDVLRAAAKAAVNDEWLKIVGPVIDEMDAPQVSIALAWGAGFWSLGFTKGYEQATTTEGA